MLSAGTQVALCDKARWNSRSSWLGANAADPQRCASGQWVVRPLYDAAATMITMILLIFITIKKAILS